MLSKSTAKLYLGYILAAVFVFLCLVGSTVFLAVIFLTLTSSVGCHSTNDEDNDSTNLVAVLGLLAVPLCIIGGLTDFAPRYPRRTATGLQRST